MCFRACRVLTDDQRKNLPAEIKEDVIKRWEAFQEKAKYDAMTPEEKKEYIAARRRERKNQRMEEKKKLEELEGKKYEDQHLALNNQSK